MRPHLGRNLIERRVYHGLVYTDEPPRLYAIGGRDLNGTWDLANDQLLRTVVEEWDTINRQWRDSGVAMEQKSNFGSLVVPNSLIACEEQ